MDKKELPKIKFKNNESEKMQKFKWESDREHFFRIDLMKIKLHLRKLLHSLDDEQPKYKDLKEQSNMLNNKIKKILVPLIYEESFKYLREALSYYNEGLKLLDETLLYKGYLRKDKTPTQLNKAGKLIETGNHLINIVHVKELEIFEKKQVEYILSLENDKENGK